MEELLIGKLLSDYDKLCKTPDIRKIEIVRESKKLLEDTVSGAIVSERLMDPFSFFGSVELVGNKITFRHPELIPILLKNAENIEMYPRTDGTVQINIAYIGLAK